MSDEQQTRCGIVAVIGAPNAGKSTLINALVGTKVSIVSPKPQTTRSVVRGVAVHGQSQIILADTPGLFSPRKRLEKAMTSAAWISRGEADVIMFVVDAARGDKISGENEQILARMAQDESSAPCVLVLNKTDKARRTDLMVLAREFNVRRVFAATFMIAAAAGDGTNDILSWLAARMPEGAWLFDADTPSDMPLRLLSAEITREHLFRQLHDELPYGLMVDTEEWEERGDGSVRIAQAIHIARESHRPMILGKGGQRIKSIGAASRCELEDILERRVHLSLFVKINERWQDDPDHYRLWGLDFSS